MIPKKHRLNEHFYTLVDEAGDLKAYVQRNDEERAVEKAGIVAGKIQDILACLNDKPIPARPTYWTDDNGIRHLQCGYCREDNAKYAKQRKYKFSEEPTHLCYGCYTWAREELKHDEIDISHYSPMEVDNA